MESESALRNLLFVYNSAQQFALKLNRKMQNAKWYVLVNLPVKSRVRGRKTLIIKKGTFTYDKETQLMPPYNPQTQKISLSPQYNSSDHSKQLILHTHTRSTQHEQIKTFNRTCTT